jgi:DNA-directed RNA polymerase
MPTIHDQLAWEDRMIAHGVTRYRNQQDKAVEGKRHTETGAGATLLRSYVLQVSDHIRLYLDGKHPEGRRRNKYANLLATVDTDKTAMIALKAIIATLYSPRNTQSVLVNIGARIEDELRFSAFEERHKEYYDEIVRSWESKRTKSTSHKRKVLSVKSRDLGMQWDQWSGEVRLGVGALVVSLLMEVCDLVEIRHEKGKNGGRAAILGPTDACIDWVMKHNEGAELGNPDRMPCIIQPEDWSDPFTGGYYSPLMRRRVPLVKGMNRAGRENLMNNAEMPEVLSAVNAMQRTGWRVNERVAEVMREVWHKNLSIGMPRSEPYVLPKCPLAEDQVAAELAEDSPDRRAFEEWKAAAREIHTMEKERVSQNLAVSRTLRMATDMGKYDAFYYVYQCDFRGRVYATASGLSPQGTDHGKGLLELAEALPLGPRGLYWLKVHGANKYGFDKADYAGRVAWVDERHEDILRAADDPVGAREVWQDADKPYQFLAFCFEYAEAHRLGDAFRSRLPVALDGSCNGLQHFSAMLRDAVGGAAVNLTPAPAPADIYQEVADVATRKLRGLASMTGEAHGGAQNWLALFGPDGMPRKLSKKPVMTLPYGSTQQACTETIFRWTQENAPDFFADNTGFRHALYLSPKLWSSISEVVIAARQAMDWLQQCAGVLAKAGHPIQFTTPLGFPVRQSSMKFETHMIETQINGRLRLRFAKDTEELDSRKQRQGSSPNFVHSIDATHMMQVINASVAAGISSFAMIHDDFGVHACNVDEFHRIIREEFVRLHSIDLLRSFKEQHEEQFDVVLPDLPPIGELDITEVLQSPYFFG